MYGTISFIRILFLSFFLFDENGIACGLMLKSASQVDRNPKPSTLLFMCACVYVFRVSAKDPDLP